MACSKQAGVAPFLHVIEAATGEKVTQSEWHAIRVLAAEASGEDLSRARVSENEAIYALYYLQWLNAKLIKGDEEMERNHDAAVLAAALDIRAATTNVTKGTVAAINYLSENGVEETLSRIRGENKDVTNGVVGMNKILITGRMSRPTLERALYEGWSVESYTSGGGSCVAIVSATVANASADYMAGRLSSFGTVGVRTEFDAEDYAEALQRL